ncbi:Adenine phosphoribosyltransferase 2 [Morus notabilis]|uniref:adenine phosphoribosyltransferase n=1 Tax=Morus notabilis TaxID=981085 RepID=W9QW58_9ROSA|nr:Adenine phosphoribosyltransferase 2 [Morus notabilis]
MFAGENGLKGDPRLQAISEAIRVVPHFPKQGIMFQDITTLLLDHKAFKDTVDIFVDRYRDMDISVVAGVEARGFMFGPSIALAIGAKFVPLRKPKKLPGKVISEEYELEYGTDCLEMHVGAVQPGERALVIDDLVATGGTLSAAIRLLERVGAEVVECACVIGLPEVKISVNLMIAWADCEKEMMLEHCNNHQSRLFVMCHCKAHFVSVLNNGWDGECYS